MPVTFASMTFPSRIRAENLAGVVGSEIRTDFIVRSGLMSSDESQWNELSVRRTELNPGTSVLPEKDGGPTILPGSARRLRPVQSKTYGNSSANHSCPRPLYDTTSDGNPRGIQRSESMRIALTDGPNLSPMIVYTGNFSKFTQYSQRTKSRDWMDGLTGTIPANRSGWPPPRSMAIAAPSPLPQTNTRSESTW